MVLGPEVSQVSKVREPVDFPRRDEVFGAIDGLLGPEAEGVPATELGAASSLPRFVAFGVVGTGEAALRFRVVLGVVVAGVALAAAGLRPRFAGVVRSTTSTTAGAVSSWGGTCGVVAVTAALVVVFRVVFGVLFDGLPRRFGNTDAGVSGATVASEGSAVG